MKLHPAVLLSISDSCNQCTASPRLYGPLFGVDDLAIACTRLSSESLPVQETLGLLRRTKPNLQLVGWYYVGYGLQPEKVISPSAEGTKVLIDASSASQPVIKAFDISSDKEVSLHLETDAASQIALENAVDFSQTQNERRAKRVLRDRVKAIKKQLRSTNEEDVSDALYKYGLLRKVEDLHKNSKRYEDDFMYELLAEVVTRSDVEYKKRHQ